MAEEEKGLVGAKPAIDSGTMVASFVALVAWIVSFWGHNMSQYDLLQLTEVTKNVIHVGTDFVGVAATIYAMYRRYNATEKVEGILRVPEKK